MIAAPPGRPQRDQYTDLCPEPPIGAMPLILLNKPFRVLSQFTDDAGRNTLSDWVKASQVYPSGRLDYDSEGLLLLTDDGALQARISQPRARHRSGLCAAAPAPPTIPHAHPRAPSRHRARTPAARLELYWRFLETADEYFPYYKRYHAFWRMYGMDLPDDVLKKIYYKNALRLIPGLDASAFPE